MFGAISKRFFPARSGLALAGPARSGEMEKTAHNAESSYLIAFVAA